MRISHEQDRKELISLLRKIIFRYCGSVKSKGQGRCDGCCDLEFCCLIDVFAEADVLLSGELPDDEKEEG